MKTQNIKRIITPELLLKFVKDYGFFLKSDSIYDGLFGIYDKGPAAVQLKKIIQDKWWDFFVRKNQYVHGYESSILTSPQTLKASGHVEKFVDQVLICNVCQKKNNPNLQTIDNQKTNNMFCFHCKNKNNFKKINYDLLFETEQGCEKDKKQKIYLRPETAQGMFTNFKKIKNIWKLNLPFGLAQIGKAFRNEITTKFTGFKSCEFELMEIEFFFAEKKDNIFWSNYWKDKIWKFLLEILQIKKDNMQLKTIDSQDLAHYSHNTWDFEYHFPFGWQEIWGLSFRGNFDLKKHQEISGDNLSVQYQNQNIIPFVMEPSAGLERLMLVMISENLKYQDDKFTLQLPFDFCYYQIAILPLTEKLTPLAQEIQRTLEGDFSTKLDIKKTIGKRYIHHDAIGTFFCLTIDFESLTDHKITIRDRNTKKQIRIEIKNLKKHLLSERNRQ